VILEERGPLGDVDARVKLAWVLATMLAGLLLVALIPLAGLLGSIVIVAMSGRVLEALFQRLRGLGAIIVVIGLILGITVPGEPIVTIGPIGISGEGLQLGLVSILRMFIFAAPLIVVVMTTNNSDLIAGFMAFKLPLDYALMMVLALNFVPLYLEEFARIADAQRARAHALVDRGFLGRARGMLPIFLPLTLNAVERADTVGKVLEIRGIARRRFQPGFEPMRGRSWALLALAGLTVAGAVILR
jgi:energy-coupling factor transporter transmembrane protein EcfT